MGVLDQHQAQFVELRERLIRVLGMPTVDSLIERAALEIASPHPAFTKLRVEDERLQFDDVRTEFGGATDDAIRGSYAALNAVLLLLVARLLGRQVALRLTDGLSIADLLEGGIAAER